ncbi:MAG: hypothetical protein AAF197_05600 [Pseudomonadota bacterium]
MTETRNTTVHPVFMALLSACFGFLFYGGWGYLVNAHHGYEMATMVFMVQGSYSFFLTLIMTGLIEVVYSGIERLMRRSGVASLSGLQQSLLVWSTIGVSCFVVFFGSWYVNVMAGTPEIWTTVLLGYVIGGLYTIAYVFALNRRRLAV